MPWQRRSWWVVPRERFMPAGTELAVAYGFDSSVVTERDEHGVAISSVSAAYIQARMLEQAELARGARVLEVGSGGLNAALICEVVGEEGRVVSVDIDPEGHCAQYRSVHLRGKRSWLAHLHFLRIVP